MLQKRVRTWNMPKYSSQKEGSGAYLALFYDKCECSRDDAARSSRPGKVLCGETGRPPRAPRRTPLLSYEELLVHAAKMSTKPSLYRDAAAVRQRIWRDRMRRRWIGK